MSLDRRHLDLIARRKQRLAWWPVGAGLLITSLLVMVTWLYIRHPLLIDPTELPRQLQAGTLQASTIALMAGMLPIAIDLCVLAAAVTLLFAGIAFHRERRHIATIELLYGRINDGPFTGNDPGKSGNWLEHRDRA